MKERKKGKETIGVMVELDKATHKKLIKRICDIEGEFNIRKSKSRLIAELVAIALKEPIK